MASSEKALANLLSHCYVVKEAAIAAGAKSSHSLLLTISRFLGKATLILEALYQVEGIAGPSDDILDDFFDAVNAISDTVSFVSRMSRLQALFQADDIRDGLKAATADLRAAVATLAPMQSFFPPDAKEDFTVLERQLASMRLGTRPSGILAAQELLWALTLDHEGALANMNNSATATTTATSTDTTDSTNSTDITPPPCISVDSALQTALSQAGLTSVSAELWLDKELAALAHGISDGLKTEPIDVFHLACAALALLHAAAMGKLYYIQEGSNGEKNTDQNQEHGIEEENAAWEKILVDNDIFSVGCGGSGHGVSELLDSKPHILLASTFQLTQKTRILLESSLLAVGKFTHSTDKLKIDDCQGLCQALSATLLTEDNENLDKYSPSLSYSVLLRQYKAAVLVSHAAEHHQGAIQRLLEAGAIPAILSALESNHHNTSVRIAAATALRTLCCDPSAREAAAAAGCLRPLARLLQSQHAGPRRAAALAFKNIIVAGEQYKRDAVEKYSIPGSLIAMLRADDALGQEAAALALANLAANSEHVQTALGRTDVFNPLSEVLHTAIGMTTTASMYNSASGAVPQHAAARAVRNLTSRVQFNRLKASAAGAVPGLVALLHSSDPEGRAVAASALATVMDGCSDALSQAVHAGATTELIKILQEDSNIACRDAAACAVVHIVEANVLQHHHSNSSTNTTTGTNTTAATAPYTTTTAGAATIATTTREPDSLVGIGISTSVLPALIALLSTGSPLARRAAARLLVFLAKYKNKDAVVAAGAVTYLVPLLAAKQDSVRREAATALCALMHRCDTARSQFLDAQGMPLLVALLKKKSQIKTSPHPAAATTIEKESTSPDATAVAGSSPLQLVGEIEERTRHEAARALGILCANNKFAQGATAAAAGAIQALVNIIKEGKESNGSSSSSSSTREAAAVTLSNLACPPSNQPALAEAAAGQALLRLLHNDSPSGCRVAAARGLSNMMADGLPDELKRSVSEMVQLLTELAMPTLTATEKDNDKNLDNLIGSSRHQNNHNNTDHNHGHHGHYHNGHEHQVAAACALGNLACADPHGAEAVAKYGGAAVLAQLCRSEIPSVREAAAQGLWESCRGSPEARHVAAVQHEVVPWLVQLLIVGEDPGKEAAAGCLAELTRCGEIVCAAAEEAGAPLLLQRLADHGSVDVAGAAAAALKALNRRSPDSPSLEHELSQRLSSLRELGSRRFDSGGEEEEEEEKQGEKDGGGGNIV